MDKISFSCMCAISAVHVCPTLDMIVTPALKLGFSREEAQHLYNCCHSIYHNANLASVE